MEFGSLAHGDGLFAGCGFQESAFITEENGQLTVFTDTDVTQVVDSFQHFQRSSFSKDDIVGALAIFLAESSGNSLVALLHDDLGFPFGQDGIVVSQIVKFFFGEVMTDVEILRDFGGTACPGRGDLDGLCVRGVNVTGVIVNRDLESETVPGRVREGAVKSGGFFDLFTVNDKFDLGNPAAVVAALVADNDIAILKLVGEIFEYGQDLVDLDNVLRTFTFCSSLVVGDEFNSAFAFVGNGEGTVFDLCLSLPDNSIDTGGTVGFSGSDSEGDIFIGPDIAFVTFDTDNDTLLVNAHNLESFLAGVSCPVVNEEVPLGISADLEGVNALVVAGKVITLLIITISDDPEHTADTASALIFGSNGKCHIVLGPVGG